MSIHNKCVLPALLLALLPACGSGGGSPAPAGTGNHPAPALLKAAEYSVGPDQADIITVDFAGGASALLVERAAVADSGVLASWTVSSGESVPVGPLHQNTRFTLTVTQPDGSVESQDLEVFVGSLSVLAGNPSGQGNLDGTGIAARFSAPYGIATDAANNVYVADAGADTIRMITPGGKVTTLAGIPYHPGLVDGPAGQAQFFGPKGLAVANRGNGTEIYVADTLNSVIRKITSNQDGTWTVSTLAGSGDAGHRDGPGNQAQFKFPCALALDANGNLFVADQHNNAVREVTPDGTVSTLATGFHLPEGIAVDAGGRVYLADTQARVIQVLVPSPGGAPSVSILAGQSGQIGRSDGSAAQASFASPQGLAVDGQGNVFVADSYNGTIRRISTVGGVLVSTIAGIPGGLGSVNGPGLQATFQNPYALALDAAGNLYVTEPPADEVRMLTPAHEVSTLAGIPGGPGSADSPASPQDPPASFNVPAGLAVDGAGNIYVADQDSGTIRQISAAGLVSTLAGTAGALGSEDGIGADARFATPLGLALGPAETLYVADPANHDIREITLGTGTAGEPVAAVSTLAGSPDMVSSQDGAGPQAGFTEPKGLAVDAGGNVYVTDANAIRKVTPDGTVSTLAGAAGDDGSQDGPGAAARFDNPFGLAVDGAGSKLYVADGFNNAIRLITLGQDGSVQVSTLALTPGDDGEPPLSRPAGLALDADGNLLVADRGNHLVRRITPAGVITTLVGTPGMVGTLAGPFPATLFDPECVAIDPSNGDLLISLPDAIVKATFLE